MKTFHELCRAIHADAPGMAVGRTIDGEVKVYFAGNPSGPSYFTTSYIDAYETAMKMKANVPRTVTPELISTLVEEGLKMIDGAKSFADIASQLCKKHRIPGWEKVVHWSLYYHS